LQGAPGILGGDFGCWQLIEQLIFFSLWSCPTFDHVVNRQKMIRNREAASIRGGFSIYSLLLAVSGG
jgi:hypothetical protein